MKSYQFFKIYKSFDKKEKKHYKWEKKNWVEKLHFVL